MTMYLIFSWNNIPIDDDDIITLFHVLYYIYMYWTAVHLLYQILHKYWQVRIIMYLTDVPSAVSNIAQILASQNQLIILDIV